MFHIPALLAKFFVWVEIRVKTKDSENFVRKFKAPLDSVSHFPFSFFSRKKTDFGRSFFRFWKNVPSHRLLLFHLYSRGRIRACLFTLYLFFRTYFLLHINPTLPKKLLLNQGKIYWMLDFSQIDFSRLDN